MRSALGLAAALLGVSASTEAAAFDLKRAPNGDPLRWDGSQVTFVVDPSLDAAVPGASAAVTGAIAGWSGVGGAPGLVVHAGGGGAKPGLDGQNSVIFAPGGFAPAGGALAVTITNYEDATGAIVDADIVINGRYAFAVLAAGAVPASEVSPVATDGSTGGGGDDGAGAEFDLVHVVSHEVGHSLGLADERDDSSALMFAFTMPGDASVRAPASDDVDGVDALYGSAAQASASGVTGAVATHAGCGQASVAGGRTRPADAWSALVLLAGAGTWLASRRRVKAVRGALPLGAALAVLCANPGAARSAPAPSPAVAAVAAQADAAARVVAVSTRDVGGVFETTVEVAVTACRLPSAAACPARAQARVWGGTLGGITQRVGEQAVPAVGDAVEVTYLNAATAIPVAALRR